MLPIEKEQQLVELAKKDLEAFGSLYDFYIKKIYAYVYRMTRDKVEAEDIVADTFEKAMLNIDKFEYRGYTFGAWLYKIARNNVYDRSKKISQQGVSAEDIEDFIGTNDYNPEANINNEILVQKLKEVIDELKPEQKEIVHLRYIEGYSIKEVCDILNKTEDSVKSLSKRALNNLRHQVVI